MKSQFNSDESGAGPVLRRPSRGRLHILLSAALGPAPSPPTLRTILRGIKYSGARREGTHETLAIKRAHVQQRRGT